MRQTVLPETIRIGRWTGTFLWRRVTLPDSTELVGGIPAGIVIDHGDHTMLLSWARYDGGPGPEHPTFTLSSLRPLTVDESVTCTICGVTGRIVAGKWVDDAE